MAVSDLDPNPRPRWDIHSPRSRAGQKFVSFWRKIYNPLGFKKGYNFPGFVIGVGALMGFVLARMMYLDIDGIFSDSAIPGEFYYYRAGHYRIAIILHLVGVLIGGFIACFQFVPIIRYKFILFHRINGYAASILLLLGNAGAFMLARHAVGGNLVMQVWVGFLGAITTIYLFLAIYNIRRLQIDQHRAWMLRTWVYATSIVSQRLIMTAAQHVIRVYGYVFWESIRCSEIFYTYSHVGVPDSRNPTGLLYPQCTSGPNGQPANVDPKSNTVVFASVSTVVTGPNAGPENIAAEIRLCFPMAAWFATVIHAIVIEIYLWLTPAENYRLRNVSYERQIEKGMRKRGAIRDAGLTSTSYGNAPGWWSVPEDDYEEFVKRQQERTDGAVNGQRGADEQLPMVLPKAENQDAAEPMGGSESDETRGGAS